MIPGAAWLAALLLGGMVQDAPPAVRAPSSPWYLERAPASPPTSDLLTVIAELEMLMRDGGVPGFYDGQFAAVAGQFDTLARLARDAGMHHVLRVMAVMALQEAGTGEALAAELTPLVMPARDEWRIEYDAAMNRPLRVEDAQEVRTRQAADLSLHARFALAKDGQPAWVLEKIEIMQHWVEGNETTLLDATISSSKYLTVGYGRTLMFEIGYHYQQYDAFELASVWYRKLTDNLEGLGDTRMAHYNLGCIAALQGRPEEAVLHLDRAYSAGFLDAAWLDEDGDLDSLRQRADFRLLRARIRGEDRPAP